MRSSTTSGERVPELAYYYGDKPWLGSEVLIDWTKSLLLFFDGVATQYSPAVFDQLVDSDPVLAQPLVDRGLLVNYAPEEKPLGPEPFDPITGEVTSEFKKFIKPITPLINAIFDQSRAATVRSQSLVDSISSALSADTLRGKVTDVAIQPVTDDEMMARLVALFVTAYQPISKARVIAGDLKTVGVDFSATPLDEILDFRRQYGSEYRSYARNLRRFTFELSLMNEGDQAFAMEERAQELEDNAEDLRRRARRAYKRPAIALAFGIAGAALMLSSGDPLAAAVEASAAIALFDTRDPMPISFSYSYIFRARGQLLR